MISDVTSPSMCIIRSIQTESQKRVGTPLPLELHEDWLSFLKNYSLGSGLFNLDGKELTLTFTSLWFILLLDSKSPQHIKTQIILPQMWAFTTLLNCPRAFWCFPLVYMIKIKSALGSVANPPFQPHPAPQIGGGAQQPIQPLALGYRRLRLTLQLHHLGAWANFCSSASISTALTGNNNYKRTHLLRLLWGLHELVCAYRAELRVCNECMGGGMKRTGSCRARREMMGAKRMKKMKTALQLYCLQTYSAHPHHFHFRKVTPLTSTHTVLRKTTGLLCEAVSFHPHLQNTTSSVNFLVSFPFICSLLNFSLNLSPEDVCVYMYCWACMCVCTATLLSTTPLQVGVSFIHKLDGQYSLLNQYLTIN